MHYLDNATSCYMYYASYPWQINAHHSSSYLSANVSLLHWLHALPHCALCDPHIVLERPSHPSPRFHACIWVVETGTLSSLLLTCGYQSVSSGERNQRRVVLCGNWAFES